MTRIVAPDKGVKETVIGGKTYGVNKQGIYNVESPSHIRAMKAEGFFEASLNPHTKGDRQRGYTCIEPFIGENQEDLKKNIKTYLDKLMDFIYMPDLISIIEFYITGTDLQKEINCIYDNTFSLSNIAKQINNLSINKVPINIEDPLPGENYIGTYNELPIAYIGLEQGIKNVYNRLK
jgi:hypothetical protein